MTSAMQPSRSSAAGGLGSYSPTTECPDDCVQWSYEELKRELDEKWFNAYTELKRYQNDGYLGSEHNDELVDDISRRLLILDDKVKQILRQANLTAPPGYLQATVSYYLPMFDNGTGKIMEKMKALLREVKQETSNIQTLSKSRSDLSGLPLVLAAYGVSDEKPGSELRPSKPLEARADCIRTVNAIGVVAFKRRSLDALVAKGAVVPDEPESIQCELARLARRLVSIRTLWKEIPLGQHKMKLEDIFIQARYIVITMASHTYRVQADADEMYDQINMMFYHFYYFELCITGAKSCRSLGDKYLDGQIKELSKDIRKCSETFEKFVTDMWIRSQYSHINKQEDCPSSSDSAGHQDARIGDARVISQFFRVFFSVAPTECQEVLSDSISTMTTQGSGNETEIVKGHIKSVQRRVARAVGGKDMEYKDAMKYLGESLNLKYIPIFHDEYTISAPSEEGGFGCILKSTHVNTKEKVAIKIIRPENTDEVLFPRNSLAHEANVWHDLEHNNVLKLIGYTEVLDGKEKILGLVSSECVIGDLFQYWKDGRVKELNTKLRILRDVANGLSYLHSRKHRSIIHGDLRAKNILIDNLGNPRLCDFGLSAIREWDVASDCAERVTNLRWLAPELAHLDEGWQAAESITTHTDMYAFGGVVHEIFVGQAPHYQYNGREIGDMKKAKQYPERPSDNFLAKDDNGERIWAFILKCWDFTPEKRPSAVKAYTELNNWLYEMVD